MERTKKLIEWMKAEEIDVTFLTSTENVFYLSKFYSNPHERLLGVAIFQREEPFLICPAMEKEEAKKAGWEHEIIGYSDIDNPWELVRTAMEKRSGKIKKIAIEKEHMIVDRYEILIDMFQDTQFISAEECLRKLRLIKDETEIAAIRKACEYADYAIQVGISEIKEGKTELEVLAAIEFEMKKKGIERMSFDTMVLTGANGASPHGTPGLTKIKKGDFILFDLGVVVDGYCSDITRTVAYGDISDKQKDIYDAVLQGQLAACQYGKPGVSCSQLDLTARNIIKERGYGEYFTHRLGHGLGISIHEYPSITETNPLILEKGMVFTIEPGIYVPQVAGVRIEDDVLVTENGLELLTKFSKELQILS